MHMSVVQTVAMATNNRKDNHFFAIFHLFVSFSRVGLGKRIKSIKFQAVSLNIFFSPSGHIKETFPN